MTEYTRLELLKTKREILKQVEEGKLGVKTASNLLGITRQGLWKLRKNYRDYGLVALIGRKRGPRAYVRPHNRTPAWVEKKIEDIYLKHGGGPDTLLWIIEDYYSDEFGKIVLSRATVYRILIRRRLLLAKEKSAKDKHPGKYAKGYPGEEVQIDTTEPYGKNKGVMLNIIDDYSRFKRSYFYQGNTSLNSALSLKDFLTTAPFPVEAVRADNGSEFKKDFARFCQQAGIRIINNPVRTPEHNGKVERLHRTVEEECLWRVPPKQRDSFEVVNLALVKHSQWYNHHRRHLGYKMNKKTPIQKIEDWIINRKTTIEFAQEVNETLILYTS
ncbi:MAG: DDE-type integrase/transposase/recombinase [Patescibacteria group bacterium]